MKGPSAASLSTAFLAIHARSAATGRRFESPEIHQSASAVAARSDP